MSINVAILVYGSSFLLGANFKTLRKSMPRTPIGCCLLYWMQIFKYL